MESVSRFLPNLSWFDLFMYFATMVAFIFAVQLEYKDLYCPHPKQKCKRGRGAVHEAGKIKDDDSYDEILRKIRISSRYDESSVYWRRTIIFTVIILYSVLIISQRRLPNGYEILSSFIVIYLLFFLFLNYYQWNVSVPATKQIDEATRKLKNL